LDFSLEAALSKTTREKTLDMRIQHLFFELHTFARDLKANGRLAGPRTSKYYLSIAHQLESLLNDLYASLDKVNYEEVE
jgi:hypothetical protein